MKITTFIAVTCNGCSFIRSLGFSGNVHLIYNGVREGLPVKDTTEVRGRYGFENDEILVLYVGRLEESKGIGFFAKSFSEIERSNIRLVVVRDGAYEMVLEQIKANHSKITFWERLTIKRYIT